jgi:hypothetical protein
VLRTPRPTPKGRNLSTESIATQPDRPRDPHGAVGAPDPSAQPAQAAPQPQGAQDLHAGAGARQGQHCPRCGAPHAADQRYCLECGERLAPTSSVLSAGAPFAQAPAQSAGGTPRQPPAELLAAGGREPAWQRNSALTVLAGVGVLLLAMGVGVLIGRAGGSKQAAGTPQVISVAGSGPTTSPTGSGESTFTSDWPAGTKGYTVELQAIPTSSPVSAVEAAKSSAAAKGAKSVGALKSDEFTSLTAGSYVIYSGVYHTRAQAQKALAGLKHAFPSAKVIQVTSSSAGSSSSHAAEPPEKQPGGTGESFNKPAPPSVLEGLKKAKGKSYEEKSKALPNSVET